MSTNRKKRSAIAIIKDILSYAVIVLLGVITIIFGVLYVETAHIAFIQNHRTLIEILITLLSAVCCLLALIFQLYNKSFVYKMTIVALFMLAASSFVLYIVKVTGLWEKIDSIESLREYVSGYGSYTIPIFILIQFLQVTVLPLPGMVTIGAGVALFGAFYGALWSFIGILSASIVSFFVGRLLGYRVASWLVGEESLQKGLKLVKGKDTIVLTFMFLFPFFPDDLLCFVAGLSSMSITYYLIMITVTRAISITLSAYSINGSLIPYNTWWGIIIWAIILIFTLMICYYVYKHGEEIEIKFKKIFKRKGANGKNDTSHRFK